MTVPGAAAGWMDTLARWGTMDAARVLEGAIALAEDGLFDSPRHIRMIRRVPSAARRSLLLAKWGPSVTRPGTVPHARCLQ